MNDVSLSDQHLAASAKMPKQTAAYVKTSHRMQMNNHQCCGWSHYTDYKTEHVALNSKSAFIKRWNHYCTASVNTLALKKKELSGLLRIPATPASQPRRYTQSVMSRRACVCGD